MKAIMVEWYPTGKREGGIDRKADKNLYCHWQNMDVFPHLEIYIVLNGNAETYRNREGVTVLEDNAAIDEAVSKYFPDRIFVYSEPMLIKSIEEVGHTVNEFDTYEDMLKFALDNNLTGIKLHPHWKADQVEKMH